MRDLKLDLRYAVRTLAVAFALFQIYVAYGPLDPVVVRVTHVAFGQSLIFLVYAASGRKRSALGGWDGILLAGLFLGNVTIDLPLSDTYFVVAHFHMVMGVSPILVVFGAIYHWFPKMFLRMMNKKLGFLHFWITIVCAYGVFFPMHFLGLAGVPRRYYTNSSFPMFDNLVDINEIVTVFAIIGALGQGVFLFNFFYSIFRGERAPQNPWEANTLEWTTPVAHLHGNWPGAIPEVHRWAYDYSVPGAAEGEDVAVRAGGAETTVGDGHGLDEGTLFVLRRDAAVVKDEVGMGNRLHGEGAA